MDSSDLAKSVRDFVDRINAGDDTAVQRHIASRFYHYVPGPGDPSADQVWGELLAGLRQGLPDLHVEIDSLEPGEEGVLSGSVTITGTHTATLWGAPPSGAAVTWQATVSVRPVDERFAVNFDGFATPELIGILRQLGLVNPPDEMHLPPRNAESIPPEFLLRVAFNGGVAPRPCSHLESATVFDTDVTVCQQCVASGDEWPSLRLCVTCGFVGCCDTSVNTHMKRHAEETGHVLMRSIRLTEGWMWCYADNAFFDSRTLARLRSRQAGS
ncbi:MAG TPA: ester cyclase [Candidatus Limnocylindrales bacterium]|nr:ester cyclase [Candidatus Limnocylindrales bacterium]